MYAQLMFFSLLSSVIVLEALRRGEVNWWIYYVLVSAAGLYTHVFMGVILTAQFFWIVLYHRRHLLPIIASSFGMALFSFRGCLLLPWVTGFARSVSARGLALGLASDGRAGFTWAAAPYTLFTYGAGFSLGPSVAELHVDKSIAFILSFMPSIAIVTPVFAVLLSIGIWTINKCFNARAGMFVCSDCLSTRRRGYLFTNTSCDFQCSVHHNSLPLLLPFRRRRAGVSNARQQNLRYGCPHSGDRYFCGVSLQPLYEFSVRQRGYQISRSILATYGGQ